ncbi:MAG: tRNA preQ1(34) S-adenosylmethionine ribosyltransferase-isomerase QueA [Bacillota bacterium]|nr:tRNA preQ1(34) S-adenosylmethionine ribosyltransferase-isomerase QueA [Bacillota bacterium]
MKTSEFDYFLPVSSIAQHPIQNRDESRLLVVGRHSGKVLHRRFIDIIEYLTEGDVLVLNDTKVFPARIHAKKASGAIVEFLLIEELPNGNWSSMVKPGRKARPGDTFTVGDLVLEIAEILPEGFREIKIQSARPLFEALEMAGDIPLPPYIHEPLLESQRYQTVFAKYSGSVAAPTAGLHFTEELLKKVTDAGCEIAAITLHVGPGTFRPVKAENISEHVMHAERYEISKESAEKIRRARRIVSVGTTAVRTLETVASAHGKIVACSGSTDIFIYPGYHFQATDALITNFHLPKSTLLMLVSAFSSKDIVLRAYDQAVKDGYRFFSFGDAMFVTDQI